MAKPISRDLIFSLICAVLFGLIIYGPYPLGFTHVDWMIQGDSINHLLGWMFYRHDVWRFPLGVYHNYLYPVGYTVTQVDAIPSMAIFFKILSPFLPDVFQYFGLWLYANLFLQFFIGTRIGRALELSNITTLILAIFIGLAPPMIVRYQHEALDAQWCLTFFIYLYIRVARGLDSKPRFWPLFFVNLFFVGVHPYLVFMDLALTTAVYFLFWRKNKTRLFSYASQLAFIISGSIITAVILGYLQVGSTGDNGFGFYSADILTFFNSMGNSWLIPHLRSGWGQYEGFAYVGAGGLLLFLSVLCFSGRNIFKVKDNYLPLVIWITFLFIFALSSHVTFGGNEILNLTWFYNLLMPLPSIFRTSGRFVWPAYYCFLIYLFVSLEKILPKKARLLFIVALFVQLIDLLPWYHRLNFKPQIWPNLPSPIWTKLKPLYDHLVLIPPALVKTDFECAPNGFTVTQMNQLAFVAAREGLTFNSGVGSRVSDTQIKKMCNDSWEHLRDGRTLYLVHPDYKTHFDSLAGSNISCKEIDGFNLCHHYGEQEESR